MICKQCEQDRPSAGLGLCRTCYSRHWRATRPDKRKVAQKRYYEANKAKLNERSAKWIQENKAKHCANVKKSRDKKLEYYRDYARNYNRENKDKIRAGKLLSDLNAYGISLAYYHLCLDKGCKICQQSFKKTPCLDHDHATGKFRGVICCSCNKLLGHAKDNKMTLQKALDYLSG